MRGSDAGPSAAHQGLRLGSIDDRSEGITVEVVIIWLEGETGWSLEVVNAKNTSIVWDELFATDEGVYAEFERTVAEEGMRSSLDRGKVIPFPR